MRIKVLDITPMDIESFKIFINQLADLSGEYIASAFGKHHSIDL